MNETEQPGIDAVPENPVPADGAEFAANHSVEPVEDLAKEYAALQEKYLRLQQQNILEKVCNESGCTDLEYFQFCAARRNIAPEDIDALRRFAGELAKTSPGCFTARITPGSYAGNGDKTVSAAGEAEKLAGDRIGLIALAIDCAPDAGYR